MVDLAQLSQAGRGIEAAPDMEFDLLPTGNYQTKIEEAVFKQTKSGDYWMIVFKLRVLVGEHKGKLQFWNYVIDHTNPDKLARLRRDLEKLGFPRGADLGSIPQYIDGFRNLAIEIRISQGKKANNNGDYPLFTNLVKVIDIGAIPHDDPRGAMPQGNFAPPPPEDEIPF